MANAPQNRWVEKANQWLWRTDRTQLHWSKRWLLNLSRILYAVIRDFTQGYTNLHAMGLVYTTILSIVPFLALSFSVLKGFGVHDRLEPVLQNLLLSPLGERSDEITENILNFVDNIRVGVLGAVGLGMLVFTVISLVQKVERAFNEAWRVSQTRPLAQRFSYYLSVILVGPLLTFSALGATATLVGSDIVENFRSVQPFGWLLSLISSLAPYFFVILLFTFLYKFIPNAPVKFKNALIGGVVAGTIWQTIGYLFAVFAANSTKFTAIYSGFAVGILLLLWIYLAWLILLIGATVAYYSQHIKQISRSRISRPSAEGDEQVGLVIMYRVAHRFDQALSGLNANQLTSSMAAPPEVLTRLLNKLREKRFLELTEDYSLVPARPLDRIGLYELIAALRSSETPILQRQRLPTPVSEVLETINQSMQERFENLTLADWVRQQPDDAADTPLPEADTEPQ